MVNVMNQLKIMVHLIHFLINFNLGMIKNNCLKFQMYDFITITHYNSFYRNFLNCLYFIVLINLFLESACLFSLCFLVDLNLIEANLSIFIFKMFVSFILLMNNSLCFLIQPYSPRIRIYLF